MREILTVLHPTDLCGLCEPAFRLACAQATEHGARLLVLHVAPTPVYGLIGTLAQEYDRLSNDLHRLQAADGAVPVEHLLRCGDPVTEILRVARALGCDLIVMGTHGHSGLRRRLRQGVAEAVTRGAPCDVLTVPALSPARTYSKAPVLARN